MGLLKAGTRKSPQHKNHALATRWPRCELIRHLEENGCQQLREGARHTIYVNPRQKKVSAVPRHKEINEILAGKICRDLEIPEPR